MEKLNVRVGEKGIAQVVVTDELMAERYLSPSVNSLSTPALINLLNLACVEAVKDGLPEGWVTVCCEVSVKHISATPKGMAVTAEAVLEKVEGYRMLFSVKAYDEIEQVAEGKIVRYALDPIKFNEKLKERKPVKTL